MLTLAKEMHGTEFSWHWLTKCMGLNSADIGRGNAWDWIQLTLAEEMHGTEFSWHWLRTCMGLNSADIGRRNPRDWIQLTLAEEMHGTEISWHWLRKCIWLKYVEIGCENMQWHAMDGKLPWGWVLVGNGLKQNSTVSYCANGINLLSSILAIVQEQTLRCGKWSAGIENLSQNDCVHHTLHTDWHGIEPGSQRCHGYTVNMVYGIRDLEFVTCTHVACTAQQF